VTWSEDSIHRWLFALPVRKGRLGVEGHDAAVLAGFSGRPVWCVDQTIEGVHFEPGAAPRRVGAKAAARALSDLAATAAEPRAILVALSAPKARTEKWIRAVLAGARAMAHENGADLVGGDLACAPGPAHVTVAALGETSGEASPPRRDRVRAGQAIVLTGPVGGSLLGRHLRIRPRVRAARTLADLGATGMMDTSDGLAWDLFRLARTSHVAIEIDLGSVPVHGDARKLARRDGREALFHALHDGEDHEILASLPPRAAARAARRIPGLAIIGRARRGAGLWLVDGSGRARRWRRSEGGFEHGR